MISQSMGVFHPVYSLFATRNRWLILLRKIWSFLNLVKHTLKNFLKFHGFQICAYFFLSFCGCWVISDFVIYPLNESYRTYLDISEHIRTYLNISEHIWTYLNISEHIWAYLSISEYIWTYLKNWQLIYHNRCTPIASIIDNQ